MFGCPSLFGVCPSTYVWLLRWGSLIEPSVLSLKGPGSVISRYLCELIGYS